MDFLKQLQAGIGQAYMPNYGSLDPAAQQNASNQAMMQLGAGMLANSRARPMEAFGQSLQGLQRQGMQNMQGQLMADQMAERKESREQTEKRRKGLSQWFSNPQVMNSLAITPELQPYFRNMAENSPEMIPEILKGLNRGPGEFTALSPEQVKAAGLPEGAVVYRGAEGWNVKMPSAGQTFNLPPTQGADKGYMWEQSQDGNWTQKPIPGGAVETSKKASDEGTIRTANVVLNKTKQALDILEQYPNATTGLTGKVAGLKSDSPAATLQRAIGTIQSNIGFGELKRMRAESPTGGALGNVTIGEIERLERVLGDLTTYQDPRILRENLIMVESMYQDMVNKIIEGGGDPSVIGAGGGGFQSSNRGGKSDVLSDDALFEKYGIR